MKVRDITIQRNKNEITTFVVSKWHGLVRHLLVLAYVIIAVTYLIIELGNTFKGGNINTTEIAKFGIISLFISTSAGISIRLIYTTFRGIWVSVAFSLVLLCYLAFVVGWQTTTNIALDTKTLIKSSIIFVSPILCIVVAWSACLSIIEGASSIFIRMWLIFKTISVTLLSLAVVVAYFLYMNGLALDTTAGQWEVTALVILGIGLVLVKVFGNIKWGRYMATIKIAQKVSFLSSLVIVVVPISIWFIAFNIELSSMWSIIYLVFILLMSGVIIFISMLKRSVIGLSITFLTVVGVLLMIAWATKFLMENQIIDSIPAELTGIVLIIVAVTVVVVYFKLTISWFSLYTLSSMALLTTAGALSNYIFGTMSSNGGRIPEFSGIDINEMISIILILIPAVFLTINIINWFYLQNSSTLNSKTKKIKEKGVFNV